MIKHLYLMRHGETLFNKRRKIQGWCDSPLTKTGILQAKAAKKCLKDISFDHYYSSTSERCCDTLEIIIGQDTPYKRLKQLKERNFGDFEGESEDLNPKRWSEFNYDDLFPHYGGEYTHDVVERMSKCLLEIMENDDHQNVLAVSHGGACYSFLSSVTDPNIVRDNGGFTNCCILHFEYNDGKFKYIDILRPEFS
ncbi:histidine phosphatase family protein [Massilimicrobiota sp. An105]|uniref:histidine phosphatase family protein n=1 Tax=Massilimicrobiota sp. An105 TaxID=1965540 RepID=UPI000B3A00E4|nr:histidine phosphatase family protein [Massilimicrobiota sp. An105]OUQ75109.1 histidine phosphatase family protein [Massilimicrobiota sp. An105]